MIQINKTPYPEFSDYVYRHNPQNWDALGGTIRTKTRKYILEEEQGNQCAYTELPLNYEKDNSHIDHLKRKDSSFFPKLTFEWSNLFVSCISSNFGGKFKDETFLKGKTPADNELIINPSIENPTDFFELKSWGEITVRTILKENEKRKAEETIRAFNLNHNSLKQRRKEMMQSVKRYKNGGLDSEMIVEFLAGCGFKSVIEHELQN